MIVPSVVGGFIGAIVAGVPGILAMGAIDFFILVLLAIVFLIALIRVFWSLLKAYVMVIINLIFAPFIILIGVLPGSNTIGTWFRNLIANLAVFPATLMMILLSFYLVYYALKGVIFDRILSLLTGEISSFEEFMYLIGDSIGNAPEMTILCFVSLGILLMAPKVSDMIKSFVAGRPFENGTALGQALGPIPMVAPYGVGYGTRRAQTWAGKLVARTPEDTRLRTIAEKIESMTSYVLQLAEIQKFTPPP